MTMASSMLLSSNSSLLQDTELSFEQSLALVKIFVNASLACICHTRALLNWSSDCFRTRFIDDVSLNHEPDRIYDAFCGIDSSSTKPSQEVRVLVRSENPRANIILDMMEGVFDALEHSFIDVLHIFVSSNVADVNAVLETYTYSFDYEGPRVTGVRIGEIKTGLSLIQSQKSFKAAIRALLRTMKDLPSLPKRRKLGMSMSFRSNCPQEYQPPCFRSAENHSIPVDDWSTMWHSISSPVIVFEAAHHLVKIAARNKEYEEQTMSQLQDTMMSKHLQNMQRTSSTKNIGLRSTVPVLATPIQHAQNLYTQSPPKRIQVEVASAEEQELPAADASILSRIKHTSRRRKISISGKFVEVNVSSSTSDLSADVDRPETEYASRRRDQTGWSE